MRRSLLGARVCALRACLFPVPSLKQTYTVLTLKLKIVLIKALCPFCIPPRRLAAMGAGYGRHAESEPPPLRNAGNEPPNRQDEFVYKALPLDTGAESSTRPSETSELCKLEGFCRRLVLTSGEAWDPSWTPPAWVMRASCARSAAKREIHHMSVWNKKLGKLAKRLYHSSTEQLRTGSAETLPAIVMRWMGEDVTAKHARTSLRGFTRDGTPFKCRHCGSEKPQARSRCPQCPRVSKRRQTRLGDLLESVQELSASEVAHARRSAAAEAAQQEQLHAEAVAQQAKRQRPNRLEVFDKDLPCREDEYKCPRCFYRNCYPRDACNKLACAKCGQSFCVQCGKPASASCRCIMSGW